MNKKCWRYFAGLIVSQANWLNKMADKGWRLVRTERLLYEFEPCEPGQYRYCVEFVGHKSRGEAEEYRCFLEGLGYRTFYKNINLNWNVGKVEARPWADRGGRLATNATTFNRELLIVEKKADGKPFELHTTFQDRVDNCKIMRRPGLYLLAVSAVLGVLMRSWIWAIFGAIGLVQVIACQVEIAKLNRQGDVREW